MSELSRRVAMAMGWRVEWNRATLWYEVTDPNGVMSIVEPVTDTYHTDADMSHAWAAAPDYAHDVSAGIAALDATGAMWVLRKRHKDRLGLYSCQINKVISETPDVEAFAATPAEAICAALEAYYAAS